MAYRLELKLDDETLAFDYPTKQAGEQALGAVVGGFQSGKPPVRIEERDGSSIVVNSRHVRHVRLIAVS